MARLGMDAARREGSGDYEDVDVDLRTLDLPAWFDCKIMYEQLRQSRNGGSYLSLGFRIEEGEASGLASFNNFTISNKSADATRIGHEQLGEVMWACGLKKGADSRMLIGKKVLVKFDLEESEQYGDKLRFVAAKPTGREPTPAPANDGPPASAYEADAARAAQDESDIPW